MPATPAAAQSARMTHRGFSPPPALLAVVVSVVAAVAWNQAAAQPSPAAVAGFERYTAAVEAQLARQHASAAEFIAPTSRGADDDARMRRGELIVEELSPAGGAELPGALLHHWRGTAFVPGATAAGFEHLLRDFNAYPKHFAPEVIRASGEPEPGGHVRAVLRVRQKHIITVVMETTYEVSFGRLDAKHGYSTSRGTEVREIDGAGTAAERTLAPDEEHGFLWRMNTYWSYEERDGGVYLQIESVTLSRGIPTGLGWIVRPLVESVPRESLEFTLRSAMNALPR